MAPAPTPRRSVASDSDCRPGEESSGGRALAPDNRVQVRCLSPVISPALGRELDRRAPGIPRLAGTPHPHDHGSPRDADLWETWRYKPLYTLCTPARAARGGSPDLTLHTRRMAREWCVGRRRDFDPSSRTCCS